MELQKFLLNTRTRADTSAIGNSEDWFSVEVPKDSSFIGIVRGFLNVQVRSVCT